MDRCVWCQQYGYDGPVLPLEPCEGCRGLEVADEWPVVPEPGVTVLL